MTHRRATVLALCGALIIAACGGSDSSESGSSDSSSFVGTGGEPGLTEAEIGDPDLVVVGSYDINGDQLEDGVDGPPSTDAAATFERYTNLIPTEYREGVVAFVAIDQEASGGTDGALQDIYDENDDPIGDRLIALDVTGSSTELERTIVHETGHLIFVNPKNAPGNKYADAFNEQFAPGAEYNPDDFVTEYAASSPEDGGEDIAEAWAMFVFADTKYAGDADDDGELDTICTDCLAADKVAFFEDYPELVELAEQIRKNAGV